MARAAGPIVIGPSRPRTTTARSSTATGGWRTSRTPSACSPTSPSRASATRTSRPRSRSAPADALGHEWAVIVDAPGYAACLVGWETPERGERIFEAVWTMDAAVVRRAAQVGAALAARTAPEWSERLLGHARGPPAGGRSAGAGPDRVDEPDDRLPRRRQQVGSLWPRDPVDRPLERLTAEHEADLRQLAGRADRGRDEFGAPRRGERLRRRRRSPRGAPSAAGSRARPRRAASRFGRGLAARGLGAATWPADRSGRLAGKRSEPAGGSRLAFVFRLGGPCTPWTSEGAAHRGACAAPDIGPADKLVVEVDIAAPRLSLDGRGGGWSHRPSRVARRIYPERPALTEPR